MFNTHTEIIEWLKQTTKELDKVQYFVRDIAAKNSILETQLNKAREELEGAPTVEKAIKHSHVHSDTPVTIKDALKEERLKQLSEGNTKKKGTLPEEETSKEAPKKKKKKTSKKKTAKKKK